MYLEDVILDVKFEQAELSFENLERIVPPQKVAPVQFDIVEGVIKISRPPQGVEESDKSNVDAAYEHLLDSGSNLVSQLSNSNCDNRLVKNVRDLHNLIKSKDNIIKTGLLNISCSSIVSEFRNEIPDAILGMLNAYSASISLYVAQFPDWERFTQNATVAELDEDDIYDVTISSGEVVEALSRETHLVEADVPKTIAMVRRFLNSPSVETKKAAFAVIRTIENLVSSIIRYGLDFISKTVEKSVEIGSDVASRTLIALLGIALISATGIGTAAARAGAPWVMQAAEIIQKQIDKMK